MSASQTPPTPHVEVHLSIELESKPITGELQIGDLAPRRFCSWLDLIAAIDAAKQGEDR
jgi:hypothetical protein